MLAAIIGQGVLGGLRVVLDARTLALVHGCTGPLFFAIASATVLMSSQFWFHCQWQSHLGHGRFGSLGSYPDGPVQFCATDDRALSYGTLLVMPRPNILWVLCICTDVGRRDCVLSFFLWASATRLAAPPTRRAALGLVLLVLVQVALGIGTWLVNYALPWPELTEELARYTILAKGYFESMVVTAHVATGSLIICFSTVASLAAWRTQAQGVTRPKGTWQWKKQLA